MVWCSRCSLKYWNIPSAWKPYPVIFEVRKLYAFIYYSVICDPFIYRLKSKINTHKSIVHIVVFNYRRVCLVLVMTKLYDLEKHWSYKLNCTAILNGLLIYLAFIVSPHDLAHRTWYDVKRDIVAQHPEYQTKTQEELDRIIGDRNTDYFDWYVFYLDYLNTSIQNGESRLEGRVWIYQRGNQTRERF